MSMSEVVLLFNEITAWEVIAMKRWNLRMVSFLFIMLSVLIIAAPSYAWRGDYGHRLTTYNSYHYGGRYVHRPYVRYHRYRYVRPYYYAPRYRPYVAYPYPYFFFPGFSFHIGF